MEPALPDASPFEPRLLLTRPEAAARRFLAEMEALAGRPLRATFCPVMAVRAIEAAVARRPDAVILTSEAGAGRAGAMGLAGLPAWCVGARTAEVAARAGLLPCEAGPDAEALVAALLAARPLGRLLHVRGEHAAGAVAARLRAGGLIVEELVAYRAEALAPAPGARLALDGPAPLVAPLFSPRSVALLAAWGPRAPLLVAAMSPAVAEAARALGPLRLVTAARPDGTAMAEATLALLEGRLEGGAPTV